MKRNKEGSSILHIASFYCGNNIEIFKKIMKRKEFILKDVYNKQGIIYFHYFFYF